MSKIAFCHYCGVLATVDLNGYGFLNCAACGLTRFGHAQYKQAGVAQAATDASKPGEEPEPQIPYKPLSDTEDPATGKMKPELTEEQQKYKDEIIERFKNLEI